MSDLSVLISLAQSQASDPFLNELASSPAFQCLDSLLNQGLLTLTQVDAYKAKYTELHSNVLSSCALERTLLDKSKQLKALHSEQTKEYRAVQSETTILHTTLQGNQATLTALTHSLHSLSHERNRLTSQSEELFASRAEHLSIMTERAEKTRHSCDSRMFDFDVEIKEYSHSLEKEKAFLDKENRAHSDYGAKRSTLIKEIESLKSSITTKQSQLTLFSSEPERLKNHVSMISKLDEELETENNDCSHQLNELEKSINEINKNRKIHLFSYDNESANIENLRLFIAKKKSNIDEILNEQQLEEIKKNRNYENYQFLIQKKLLCKNEYFHYNNEINEIIKQIEIHKKKIEKFRRKRETILSLISPLKQQIENKINLIKKYRDDSKYYSEIQSTIYLENENYIVQLLNNEDKNNEIFHLITNYNSDIIKREELIKTLRNKENSYQKEIANKISIRNLLLRDYSKLIIELNKFKQELILEKLKIKDIDKSFNDYLKTIEMCGEKYELLKNQKNSLMNLFNTTQATLNEIKEKSRILTHEYIILNQENVNKDKKLLTKKSELTNCIKSRDLLRNEENRLRLELKSSNQSNRAIKLEVKGFQETLITIELSMKTLNNNYEIIVNNRNSVGLLLIDRNDELCLLYQQRDAINGLLNEKTLLINSNENLIMKKNREISEMERRIEMARKQIPSILQFEELIKQKEEMERKLKETNEQVEKLGLKLETPPNLDQEDDDDNNNTSNSEINNSRIRLLGGVDPDPDQLCLKIESFEQIAETKKKLLLDSELTLNEVLQTNEKLKIKLAETRTTSVNYSVHLNRVRQDLRLLTRTMMSNISELSLYQANYLQLTKEKEKLQEELNNARENFNSGQPPTSEAEAEWQKLCRDKQRKREALLNAHRSREELELMASLMNSVTTAEVRPNAYINETLGIPKPYGGLAPFKPSQLGAQMRHFRIPVNKEIQL